MPFSIKTILICSTSFKSWVTVSCEALSVEALVVNVQPATKEIRDIIADMAITLGRETPFLLPPNMASIFWSAFESLTPSLFRVVAVSSL